MKITLRAHRAVWGFSLLELMIVLMLMVGLLAIAWPNMQRSLRRTTLNEAAQTLREAIDEGRNEAMTTGRPVFVQMQQGNHEVRTGSFANFANDEDSNNSTGNGFTTEVASSRPSASLTSQQSESQADSKSPRKWRLPDSVVIAEVNWTSDSHSDANDENEISTSSELSVSHRSSSLQELGNHDSTSHDQVDATHSQSFGATEDILASIDGVHSDWWLPFSATGQGRSASIVLYDKSIHEKMTITYAADTGALEIVR